MIANKHKICPVEHAGVLDFSLRKWMHNPHRILSPYVKSGMTVLDLGAGPGFFTLEMARLVGESGKVIAADLQEGMLEKIRTKVQNTYLEKIITLHKVGEDKIGLEEKVDFALFFYVLHEVPNQEKLLEEIKTILKGNFSIQTKNNIIGTQVADLTLNHRNAENLLQPGDGGENRLNDLYGYKQNRR